MTRQTTAPIERLNLQDSYRTARELARMVEDGLMTLDAPYQRGSVWSVSQRIALVRSWLSGTPIPSIIVNDRANGRWAAANGGRHPGMTGEPVYAVIDGKQRLETALAWFGGRLAVPATWFPLDDVNHAVVTADGLYVRYTGLSDGMQRHMSIGGAMLPMAEAKVESVQAEAEIYLRVNGYGTPQEAADLDRARRIARR